MKKRIFLSLLITFIFTSCSPPKPDGSTSIGSKEDLILINKFIHTVESKSGKDISHDDVIVSRKGNMLWVFIKTDEEDKDFYYAVEISNYDNEMAEGNFKTISFIVENLSPTYRHGLIMKTRMFGNAVGYDLYANSIDPGNLFEEDTPTLKDLEKVGALMEGLKIENRSNSLVENFGLSESRAYEVAKLTFFYEKIKRKRALSGRDADLVYKKILGSSYLEIKKAYNELLQGDKRGFDDALQLAAEVNQIDPESMFEIIQEHISL